LITAADAYLRQLMLFRRARYAMIISMLLLTPLLMLRAAIAMPPPMLMLMDFA